MPKHQQCILLAAAVAHAFPTNDAERTAFAYLINGTEPADGLLEVDANVYRKPKTQPFEEDKKCAAASAARRPARAAARGSADAGLGCAGA